MNFDRLYKILGETVIFVQKGVTQDNQDSDLAVVNLHFHDAIVSKGKLEEYATELRQIISQWSFRSTLARGPSFIEVGAELGDQGAALQLFAAGQVLGLWKVITPEFLGFEGAEAKNMAGRGMVMISGLKEDLLPG